MTMHQLWSRFISGVLLVAFLIGALIIVSQNGSTTNTKAEVVGTFRLVGGPAPGESIPTSGVVHFTLQGHPNNEVSVNVGTSGLVVVQLEPGTWLVTANSPRFIINNEMGACGASAPLKVKAGKRASLFVQCEIP